MHGSPKAEVGEQISNLALMSASLAAAQSADYPRGPAPGSPRPDAEDASRHSYPDRPGSGALPSLSRLLLAPAEAISTGLLLGLPKVRMEVQLCIGRRSDASGHLPRKPSSWSRNRPAIERRGWHLFTPGLVGMVLSLLAEFARLEMVCPHGWKAAAGITSDTTA